MAGLATIDPYTGYAVLLVAQLVVGMGVGAALTTIVSVTLQDVLPDDSGVAGALTNATQQIGGAMGISLLNVLVLAVTSTATDPDRPTDSQAVTPRPSWPVPDCSPPLL
jgi:MFS family permease